jgi:hypothetical protein
VVNSEWKKNIQMDEKQQKERETWNIEFAVAFYNEHLD